MTTVERQTKTEATRVRLTPEALAWLRDYANTHDRSVSSVIRLALQEFYEKRAK